MDPMELVNIAYQEDVEVEPTANIPDIHLLEYDIQNLKPLQISRVPLYIALSLKKSNLCRIRLPSFLKHEYLEEIISLERENVGEYAKIHRFFFELSDILIKHAYNVENPDRLRLLIQELKEARFQKTYEGMKVLDGHAFNINNLTGWEFNEIRHFVLKGSEEAARFVGGNK